MNLRFTPAQDALRAEIRAFLAGALPATLRERLRQGWFPTREEIVDWQRRLAARGWGAPNWPREFGGTGWTEIEQLIFLEETCRAPAPAPHVFNVTMLGPVLIRFGTEAQRAAWLPRLLRADVLFCQGFSEPEAGSDLASLRSSATVDADDYLIDGQKTWTTSAHYADWIFCLLRTDAAAPKHKGISLILVPLDAPGVTVRPIVSIDGRHSLNEVFFDRVRVPRANLVGQENHGWDYARYLLGNERTSIAGVARSRERLDYAVELAGRDGRTRGLDPGFRRRVAALDAELAALDIAQYRALADSGAAPGDKVAAASVLKLKGTELFQQVMDLLLEAGGPEALRLAQPRLGDAPAGADAAPVQALGAAHLYSRAASIYGGANEIQRNLLARHVFGERR